MTSLTDPEIILEELRSCRSIAEVNHVARKYGAEVSDMLEIPTLHVRAIHIRNMAKYKRLTLACGDQGSLL